MNTNIKNQILFSSLEQIRTPEISHNWIDHNPARDEKIVPEETHYLSLSQNWIELSTSALQHNVLQFKEWLGPNTQIAGVIKSNAYGHGIAQIAKLYEQCDQVSVLCVINLSEAVYIRQFNIKKPILVIGYLDTDYDFIVQYDIEVVIYDFEIACKLNEIGKKHNQKIHVHIKFDTGMSRLGIVESDLDAFIKQVEMLPWIVIQGIFSHFAEAYNATKTQQQESVFLKSLSANYHTHISNSHGVFNIQNKFYSFARIGIGLYGYLQKQNPDIQNKLKPVLSLKTKILQIKRVSAGSFIGYDGMYQASSDMIIAIIAMGYCEGIDARLSNLGSVIINGCFAPIVGRVCMNLTIVNITNIPNCTTGQVVTVLGKEGDISISVYDWSAITKASVYNLLTKLSAMIHKIIVK